MNISGGNKALHKTVGLLAVTLLVIGVTVLICKPSEGLPVGSLRTQTTDCSQADYGLNVDIIEGYSGAASSSADIFVDGRIERQELSDAKGAKYVRYVLRRVAPAEFDMHYHSCGHHVRSAVTDMVVLWPQPYDENSSTIDSFASMLWENLVGSNVSVRGELYIVSQDGDGEVVCLDHPLPSDHGVLGRQIGVPILADGFDFYSEDYGAHYSWDDVERLADAMAASKSAVYGNAIAEVYGISTGSKARLQMADGSTCELEVSDIMTEVEDGYVGISFVQINGTSGVRFGLGGFGNGLPSGASNSMRWE